MWIVRSAIREWFNAFHWLHIRIPKRIANFVLDEHQPPYYARVIGHPNPVGNYHKTQRRDAYEDNDCDQ